MFTFQIVCYSICLICSICWIINYLKKKKEAAGGANVDENTFAAMKAFAAVFIYIEAIIKRHKADELPYTFFNSKMETVFPGYSPAVYQTAGSAVTSDPDGFSYMISDDIYVNYNDEVKGLIRRKLVEWLLKYKLVLKQLNLQETILRFAFEVYDQDLTSDIHKLYGDFFGTFVSSLYAICGCDENFFTALSREYFSKWLAYNIEEPASPAE